MTISSTGRVLFRLALAACAVFVFARGAAAQVSPRSRVSFNAGWRFQKDDPPGAEGRLSYEKMRGSVTATGGEFVAGAAPEPVKADEKLGADVVYTQREFDDSAWRQLNLPHDWGIEGPFKQEYPGETGKLAWWGVGWYRKHFTVPAADRGQQIYLDLDGAMSYAAVWLNGRFVGGWPYGYASFRLDLTPFVEHGAENVVV
ncbi:MAG: sugar-binding domain-containing protein, partial [Pyrinomonadaceae bacterium]